jgi:spermidine/putrescine transport system permease protein
MGFEKIIFAPGGYGMSERARPRAPIWAFVILGTMLIILYLPILVMMINSFMVRTDAWHFSFDWYAQIWHDDELVEALARSLEVGIVSSTLATALSGLAAIALLRSRFRWAKMVNTLSYLSLILPELVFALALLSWFFILKIQLSLVTVIFAHVTFSLAFVLMTVNGRLASLDESIEDAARDLGASELLILRRVIIPAVLAALASGFLLAFLLSFDDFLITFYTSGVGSDTLPIRLYTAMKTGLNAKLSALATIMFLLTFLLILGLSKLRGLKQILTEE